MSLAAHRPHRWVRLVVGAPDAFAAFLEAWRNGLQAPGGVAHLVVIVVDAAPLPLAACDAARRASVARQNDAETALLTQLCADWPTGTPGWHSIEHTSAHGGQLSLMWGIGPTADLLRSLLAHVHEVDVHSADEPHPPWLPRLARLAAPGAILRLSGAATAWREALIREGFVDAPSPAATEPLHAGIQLTFAPRHTAALPPGGWQPELPPERRHALVLGAGLAGASATLALVQAGWRVTLMDQHGGPAQATSGNAGGLFHSIVHGEDGVHARAHRAAAWATWRQVRPWMAQGRVNGQCDGLLRLDPKVSANEAIQRLAHLGLPLEHVQWLDAEQAASHSGIQVPSGAWLFHQAGWLNPHAYVTAQLDAAAACHVPGVSPFQSALTCCWHQAVDRIQRVSTPQGRMWQVLDQAGQVLGQAPVLVLANAQHSLHLLDGLQSSQPQEAVTAPPLSAIRGQITQAPAQASDAEPALPLPAVPLAGSGYALALDAHTLLCGATTHHHDPDLSLRPADQRRNLQQAERLGILGAVTRIDQADTSGRVGWRASTPDRLPLVGALPWSHERLAHGPRLRTEQVRALPRERDEDGGLYMLSGLGSRGITWSALAGRLLAHWVTGTPCPVEVDLRDAMDPARFLARAGAASGPQANAETRGASDTARTAPPVLDAG